MHVEQVARVTGLMGFRGLRVLMGFITPEVQLLMGVVGPMVQLVMGVIVPMVQLVMGPVMVIVDAVAHAVARPMVLLGFMVQLVMVIVDK